MSTFDRIAIVFLLTLTAATASGLEERGSTLVLTPQEVASCRAEGGCALVTKRYMDAVQRDLDAADAVCDLPFEPAPKPRGGVTT